MFLLEIVYTEQYATLNEYITCIWSLQPFSVVIGSVSAISISERQNHSKRSQTPYEWRGIAFEAHYLLDIFVTPNPVLDRVKRKPLVMLKHRNQSFLCVMIIHTTRDCITKLETSTAIQHLQEKAVIQYITSKRRCLISNTLKPNPSRKLQPPECNAILSINVPA